MDILAMVIIVFALLEISNIIMLYFFPGSKKGNGMGVFDAYEKSKEDRAIHDLVKYLINWVAGTKLIFIALLTVILITGDYRARLFSVGALILSILTFYWRLFPLIKKMDREGQVSPKGYSKTLAGMIGFFLLAFVAAMTISMIL